MKWSLEHYNLICYGSPHDNIFSTLRGHSSFPKDRLWERTDESLVDQYSVSELDVLPSIVVAETDLSRANSMPAFLTEISNVRLNRHVVQFEYQHYISGRFTSEDIFLEMPDIGQWENTRTHWAVKRGNAVAELCRIIRGVPMYPKIFNVSEPLNLRDHIAVMMPFDDKFTPVYDSIRHACEQYGKAIRVDEVFGPTQIVSDIFRVIEEARLVVADVTDKNPNVLYEIGLAHGRDKTVVILTQDKGHVPFDLSHLRHIRYLNNDEGRRELFQVLEQTLGILLN